MDNATQGSNPTPKQAPIKPNPMNGMVGDAASSAHGAIDKAAAVAGSAVHSVGSAIDNAAASGHQAISKVEEKAKPAERWIHEKADAALALPRNAVSDARQYVVTHPWQSLGIAAFAGFLFGRKTR